MDRPQALLHNVSCDAFQRLEIAEWVEAATERVPLARESYALTQLVRENGSVEWRVGRCVGP